MQRSGAARAQRRGKRDRLRAVRKRIERGRVYRIAEQMPRLQPQRVTGVLGNRLRGCEIESGRPPAPEANLVPLRVMLDERHPQIDARGNDFARGFEKAAPGVGKVLEYPRFEAEAPDL